MAGVGHSVKRMTDMLKEPHTAFADALQQGMAQAYVDWLSSQGVTSRQLMADFFHSLDEIHKLPQTETTFPKEPVVKVHVAAIKQAHRTCLSLQEGEAVQTKDAKAKEGGDATEAEWAAPIGKAKREELLDVFFTSHKFRLHPSEVPWDGLMGRLYREAQAKITTPIALGKVKSLEGIRSAATVEQRIGANVILQVGVSAPGDETDPTAPGAVLAALTVLLNGMAITGQHHVVFQGQTMCWCSYQCAYNYLHLCRTALKGPNAVETLLKAHDQAHKRAAELVRNGDTYSALSDPEKLPLGKALMQAATEKHALFVGGFVAKKGGQADEASPKTKWQKTGKGGKGKGKGAKTGGQDVGSDTAQETPKKGSAQKGSTSWKTGATQAQSSPRYAGRVAGEPVCVKWHRGHCSHQGIKDCGGVHLCNIFLQRTGAPCAGEHKSTACPG